MRIKKLSTGNIEGKTKMKSLKSIFEGGTDTETSIDTYRGTFTTKKIGWDKNGLRESLSKIAKVTAAPSDGFGGQLEREVTRE